MHRIRKIRSNLFISYSLLIIVIIITFVAAFYLYAENALETKASESLFQLAASISAQFDNELKTMDTISSRAVASKLFRDTFYNTGNTGTSFDLLKYHRDLDDVMLTIVAPQFTMFQVNVFTLDGKYYGYGKNFVFDFNGEEKIRNLSWVKDVLPLKGSRLILPSHKTELKNTDTTVISLCRAFSQDFDYNNIDTVIEVQQSFSVFSDIIGKSMNNNFVKSPSRGDVFIFDDSGKPVYPLLNGQNGAKDFPDMEFYWSKLKESKAANGRIPVQKPSNNDAALLVYSTSGYSGWTVMLVESKKALLSPVTTLRNSLIVVGIVLLLITMLLSFFIAGKLSNPIKELRNSVKSLNIEALSSTPYIPSSSGIEELEDLGSSFREMCSRLQMALDQMIANKTHEIQACLLALQSQINPHFLYNTLATITIMAKEGNQPEIAQMCRDLSGMLRYISSEGSKPVSVALELEHTEKYLNIIRARHGSNIQGIIEMPQEILEQKIPKLIIQPLVENSVKYGTDFDPPWLIYINGRIEDGLWFIEVSDNGKGFHEEFLQNFSHKMDSINLEMASTDLQIEGMGLLNIYFRLKFLYRDNAVFKLMNRPEGGAAVIVGGPYGMEGLS